MGRKHTVKLSYVEHKLITHLQGIIRNYGLDKLSDLYRGDTMPKEHGTLEWDGSKGGVIYIAGLFLLKQIKSEERR